jgi:hypothetical protein
MKGCGPAQRLGELAVSDLHLDLFANAGRVRLRINVEGKSRPS